MLFERVQIGPQTGIHAFNRLFEMISSNGYVPELPKQDSRMESLIIRVEKESPKVVPLVSPRRCFRLVRVTKIVEAEVGGKHSKIQI